MGNAPPAKPVKEKHFIKPRRSEEHAEIKPEDHSVKVKVKSGKPEKPAEVVPEPHADQDHEKKASCCGNGKHGSNCCLKTIFVILAIIIVIKSIALIAVSVSTAIATQIYSSDLSGRLVAMIILAVTAAVVLSVIIYAVVAIFRKKVKPLHAASAALIILAIIQAVIAGVSVRVTQDDEVTLSRSLIESFRLARDDNPRHMKMWATTQHDLTCCGVYSPDDYRRPGVPNYFPPDVPISCCPAYDPDRSDIVQERVRNSCKTRGEFYQAGCKGNVLQVFKETSSWVLSVTITLIVLEVIEAILGAILSKKEAKKAKQKSLEEGAGAAPENIKSGKS